MNAAGATGRSLWLRLRRAVVVLLAVLWAATAVATVGSGERGVVLRFGRAQRFVDPGVLLKLPWPFERVERVDVELLRRMPIGYRLEDSLRNIDPLPSEVQWLTGDTNIVELRANVLYRVHDPVAWLFGVSDGEGDDGHRSFTLRRLGERALTSILARTPVREVLAQGNTRLQIRARDAIQAEADALGLGVRVSAVEIQSTAPPLMVVHAFNSVTDARAQADRLVVEARGRRAREVQNADAQAKRILSDARTYALEHEGRARAITQQIETLNAGVGLSPAATRALWSETLRRILTRARITIVPASPGDEPVPLVRYR